MALTDDLTTFFDTDDFAVVATVTGGSLLVIFDAAGKGVDILTGKIESTDPQCVARSLDVATYAIGHGTTITINTIVYRVTGVDPDGTGLTTLTLRKS